MREGCEEREREREREKERAVRRETEREREREGCEERERDRERERERERAVRRERERQRERERELGKKLLAVSALVSGSEGCSEPLCWVSFGEWGLLIWCVLPGLKSVRVISRDSIHCCSSLCWALWRGQASGV